MNPEPVKAFDTQLKIAKALRVDPRNLRQWRADFSDAPEKVNGKEPLEAWREFMVRHRNELGKQTPESKKDMEALKLAKVEKEIAILDKRARELDQKHAIMAGKFIPRDAVESQLSPLVGELVALIKDRDTELSNWAPGRTTGEIRKHQSASLDTMFAKIRQGTSEFIESAQAAGKLSLALEPTSINAPGAGRPPSATSRRGKQRAKAAKKKEKK